MLALGRGWAIVVSGSVTRFSVLSGKRHQGRTAGRAGEPLHRTALGGRYQLEYNRFRKWRSDLLPHAQGAAVGSFGVSVGRISEEKFPGCQSVAILSIVVELTTECDLWLDRKMGRATPPGRLTARLILECDAI
jgi:hypothetical protein